MRNAERSFIDFGISVRPVPSVDADPADVRPGRVVETNAREIRPRANETVACRAVDFRLLSRTFLIDFFRFFFF